MPGEYREKALKKAIEDEDSTKARILHTAEDLFAQKGYKGTTIRDIADTVGVNVALIHYHWGSKEELWNAVHHYRVNSLFEVALEMIEEFQTLDSPEALERIAERFFEVVSQNPNTVLLMAQVGPEAKETPWLQELGPAFLEAGVEFVERNPKINLAPLDTKIAIMMIIGSFVIFFIRPELIRAVFGEDPMHYSEEFKAKASESLGILAARLAQIE